MRLLELGGENFGPFRKFKVRLNNRGLIYIEGINKDDPNANSNGAGKTELIDAMTFVIHGRTTKGLSGDDVINKDIKKDCYLYLNMEDDEVQGSPKYSIIRARKHKEYGTALILAVNGKNISESSMGETQQKINNLLGMNFATYCQSVAFLQNSLDRFSSATDSEKKAILEQILNIKILSKCHDKINKLVKTKKNDRNSAQTKLEILVKDRTSEVRLIETLQAKQKEVEEKKQKTLEDLKGKIASIGPPCETLEKSIREVEPTIFSVSALKEKLKEHKDNLEALSKKVKDTHSKFRLELVPKEALRQQRNREYEKIRKDVEKKHDAVGSRCPYCTQDIPLELIAILSENLLKTGNALKQEIDLLDNEIAAINVKYETIFSQAEEFEKYEKENAESLQKAIDESKQKEQQVSGWKRELNLQTSKKEELQELYTDLTTAKTDGYADTIEATELKIKRMDDDIEKTKKSIVELDEEIPHLEFWQHGFSNEGLKSYILDSVVPILNIRANHYADILTGGTMQINFSTQSKNKSGNTEDNFKVEVFNKYGGENYKSSSGGERRRIDIAVMMAMQDLVASRSRKKLNICVFDEMFEGCDSSGVEAVMMLLNEIAKTKDSVFVITHHEELKNRFSNTLTVVKENGVSNVIDS